ncbi:hypothetical protein VaNZ11_007127 [Volvox africanus]|uniref:CCHC-type domain-containing protein n=1 Tax=Volvox africanus TaxID=51714 RepID=A0ABQ5S235_9CHLO|nr:hypothetical protein VaNZ11_007127 [Volvox africanus]
MLAKRKVQSEPATTLYAGRGGGSKFSGCYTCGGDHLGSSSAASGSGRSSGGPRMAAVGSGVWFDWCGKPGHVEERCFQKRQGKPKTIEGKPKVVVLTLVAREHKFMPHETEGARLLREYKQGIANRAVCTSPLLSRPHDLSNELKNNVPCDYVDSSSR